MWSRSTVDLDAIDPVTATVVDASADAVAEVATEPAPANYLLPVAAHPVTLARAEPRDAPYCYQCGNAMQRAGSCYVCGSCGTTSGCS